MPGFRVVPPTAEALAGAVDERTAAVLLEPIQGETGVHVLAPEVLQAARDACDAAGAALVFDEVQCGVGRTGSLWAYEQAGVVPDAMTLAKGLGGGMAIGALVIGPALDGVFAPGDHGSTFAGGPVAAAAANAVLDVVDDPAFLSGVHERGERLAEGLRELPGVTGVRGRGLMVAAELEEPTRRHRPPRAARGAPDHQRHGPDDAALPPAADGHRRRGRYSALPAVRTSLTLSERRRRSAGRHPFAGARVMLRSSAGPRGGRPDIDGGQDRSPQIGRGPLVEDTAPSWRRWRACWPMTGTAAAHPQPGGSGSGSTQAGSTSPS